jgi:hypothetical protein
MNREGKVRAVGTGVGEWGKTGSQYLASRVGAPTIRVEPIDRQFLVGANSWLAKNWLQTDQPLYA